MTEYQKAFEAMKNFGLLQINNPITNQEMRFAIFELIAEPGMSTDMLIHNVETIFQYITLGKLK